LKTTKGITPSNNLGYYISRLRKAISNEIHRAFLKLEIDIRLDQWLILMKLKLNKDVSQNMLAEMLHRDKGTITRSVNRLMELGLITRVIDDEDKRIKRIQITAKGSEWHSKGLTAINSILEVADQDILENELDICKDVLDKMYNNLLDFNT